MTTATSRSQIADNADPPSTPDTSLRGRRLVIARVVWLAIAICSLLLFVVALPLYVKLLETVCVGASCLTGQVNLQTMHTLQRAGISLDAYMIVNVTLTVISALLWMGIGLLMFWRKSSDWMVLIFSLWFMTQILSTENVSLAGFQQAPAPFLNIIGTCLLVSNLLDTSLVFLVFAVFPNGRFAPRWMRWVAFLAIALLRYRLWDVDVLINRALVYSLLTAILALLYFGSVLGLQALFTKISEQTSQSPLIIVGSTLIIAALFQPLRHRIQNIIDRRFYRRKYDAKRTVANFSTTLRAEVDLTQLSEQLITVVEETMQPAHVSLWLSSQNSIKTISRLDRDEGAYA